MRNCNSSFFLVTRSPEAQLLKDHYLQFQRTKIKCTFWILTYNMLQFVFFCFFCFLVISMDGYLLSHYYQCAALREAQRNAAIATLGGTLGACPGVCNLRATQRCDRKDCSCVFEALRDVGSNSLYKCKEL